jgi:hypothetical protein
LIVLLVINTINLIFVIVCIFKAYIKKNEIMKMNFTSIWVSGKFLLPVFICVLFFSAQQAESQNVFFVKTNGNDSNDGLSWETAFSTVQKGIDMSFGAGGSFEVWVAHGTYHPTDYLSDYFGQQSTGVYKSFIMYSGVNVYGGFEGVETTREVGVPGGRQLTGDDTWDYAYPTILDGSPDNSYHVVWFASNGFVSISYQGVSGVMIPQQLPQQTILEGFTIRGGFANIGIRVENSNDSKRRFTHLAGGGVAIVGNGEIHNCIIEENLAKYGGAGIAAFDGALVNQCLIRNNEAIGANFYLGLWEWPIGISFDYWRTDGAGMVAMGSEDNIATVSNSVISDNLGRANDNYPGTPSSLNNKTNNGGGIYLANGVMINSVVSGNNIVVNPSPYDDGAAASCGGGVYVFAKGLVENCEIYDNGFLTGSQNGAGIFMADYTQDATSYEDLVIRNSFVHTNRAGGGVAIDAQYSTIENSIVANNTGNGIYGYGNCRRLRTVNSIMYNNSAAGWGQTANANNRDNQLINSTVVRNSTGVAIGNTNNHVVRNSLVWGNNSNPATISNATVSYSAFSFTPPAGTGNIQIDTDNEIGPRFVNPTSSHGINQTDWLEADWRIQMGSQCIDMGDASLIPAQYITDLYGNGRVIGCNIDIGAHESLEGGPVISLGLNGYEFGQSFSTNVCVGEDILMTFEQGISGEFPITISWTINDDPGHPFSGENVELNNPGQVLFEGSASEAYYYFKITEISDATSCEGNPDIYEANITIDEPQIVITLNDINITDQQEIGVCDGQMVEMDFNNAVIGNFPFTLSWSVNGDSEHIYAGVEVIIENEEQALINEILPVGEYDFEFTYIEDGTGCEVSDLSDYAISLNVNNNPAVLFALNGVEFYEGHSEELCQGTNVEFSFAQAVQGDYPFTISWTVNDDIEHELSQQNIVVSGEEQILFSGTPEAGVYDIQITQITDANDCSPIDLSVYNAQLIINELPVLTCPSDVVIAENEPYTLQGAIPEGGEYSGQNVIEGVFNPDGLVNGVYIIIYSYSDPLTGCDNYCEFTISVEIPSTIQDIDIYDEVADIEVCYGTSEEDLISMLPDEISISDDQGIVHLVSLLWEIDSYDEFTADDYVATGTFELPPFIEQTEPETELIVTALITVNPEPEISLTIDGIDILNQEVFHVCYNQDIVEFSFDSAIQGNYPFIISWTVNGSLEHPLAGEDVVVEEPGQVLFNDFIPDVDQFLFQLIHISDTDGCEAELTEYSFVINGDICEDIAENSSQINIYPNPVKDKVFIENTGSDSFTKVSLICISGKTVVERNIITNYTEIDASSLSSGLYMLKIETEYDTIIRKIVIE